MKAPGGRLMEPVVPEEPWAAVGWGSIIHDR